MSSRTKSPVLFVLLAGTMMLAACTNTAEDQNDRMNSKMDKVDNKLQDMNTDGQTAFERDRQSVISDLTSMRDNINDKLKDTNDRLAHKELKPSERTEKEKLKAELEKEQAMISDELDKVNNATASTWKDVRVGADKVSTDVKTWWSGMKEDVDKRSDADKDNDGH